jgi:hypothetical protein
MSRFKSVSTLDAAIVERLIPVRNFSISKMREALATHVDHLIPRQLHGLQMGVAMCAVVAVFVATVVFAAATGGYKGYQVIAKLQAEAVTAITGK